MMGEEKNAEETAEQPVEGASTAPSFAPSFMRMGLEHLYAFNDERLDLSDSLADIESLGGPEAKKKARKLMDALDSFEPSVTMIGQIKSGKTSLVNAMVGRPDLLPSDVNPWTSVVTSLHLNDASENRKTVASFQMFQPSEWDHLVENGGRIGEISGRAGASEELEKVQAQIAEMREKTKARLGKKFELLLGQTHEYRHLDDELIQRYVCMGDDFADSDAHDAQGQFADITKSADLYIDAPALPHGLCLRDTPGVNDTFMMREQITINALRSSRICVVVLSATQALTSMDMGLIRLISNVKSREVVIFVNRIDELSDPVSQVAEIKESILKTLADNNAPSGLEIIFGSAHWALMALQGRVAEIDTDSAAALEKSAGVESGQGPDLAPDLVWDLSGVPDLYHAISRRIAEGEGAEMLVSVKKRALNHLHGLKASSSIVSLRLGDGDFEIMDPTELRTRLIEIESRFKAVLDSKLDTLVEAYARRIDTSHKSFLDRALESLLQHLETKGEKELWQYSPDGLRMLLRSGYQSMRVSTGKACQEVFAASAHDVTEVYRQLLTVEVEGFEVVPPSVPQFPPPVALGQTIALDLQSTWWSDWWKRRKGYRAYADSFYELIEAETHPIVADLKSGHVEDIRRIATEALQEFLAEQRGILTDVSNKGQVNETDLKDLFGVTQQEERDELFQILLEELAVDESEPEEVPAEVAPRRPARPAMVPPLAQSAPTHQVRGEVA